MSSFAIQGLKKGFLKMGDFVILISGKTGSFFKSACFKEAWCEHNKAKLFRTRPAKAASVNVPSIGLCISISFKAVLLIMSF